MKRSSSKLVLTSACALLLSFQQAAADCLLQDSRVTCTGEDDDGYRHDQENITVVVSDEAAVHDHGDAIKVEASGLSVVNHGTIVSEQKDAIQSGNGLSVYNHGAIIAGDEGIAADDPPTRPYSNAFVFNSGRLAAADDAIKIGARGTIVNFGVIENTGTDVDDPQDAIDIDSGVIINQESGVIRSILDAAIDFDSSNEYALVTNRGVIAGKVGVLTDPENSGSQEILNMGTIEGTSGVSIQLGSGEDSVSLMSGGRFLGTVALGSGRDEFLLGEGSFGDTSIDFMVDGGSGLGDDHLDLTGFGTITDIMVTRSTPDTFDLSVGSKSSNIILRISDFERFTINGATMSLSELVSFELQNYLSVYDASRF
ncbi:hypothetical protein [Loktanella sp. Alg231-35]|uniref:hypothetical protein n=1 Tax=Loktanella sp. Alg231-35 TaxID=1922220 RepID=UPI00131F2E5A|nr:hypothetical protein [Loktanella sp. Alg231-35]